MEPENSPAPFHIEISSDRLSAILHLAPAANVSANVVIAELNKLNITGINDAALNKCLAEKSPGPVSVPIASGLAPIDERPFRVDYRVPLADDESGTVSKVAEGQVLATYTAPPPGTDGRDVCGQPLPFKKCLSTLKDAKNVLCTKGDASSTIRGNVRLRDNMLSVEPLLELLAEQHIGSTQIEFDGDISVKGCLTDAWRLRASGSLISSGVVEAAHLAAMGSIHIRGGIIGKDKGLCKAKRHVWSRFLSHACVIAGGDIHVKGEIVQSRVTCAGMLKAMGGPICGGILIAGAGIQCKVIGTASGTPTIVEAGAAQILPATTAVAEAEINANRKRVRGIREKIVPLMKQLKSLTPQQRERATELLYEADELEEQTNQRDALLAEECRVISAAAHDEIVVSDIIYQGVTLRLSRMETTIQTALKGPFKITSRKEGNSTQIILIEESGKAAHILDSHRIDRSGDSTEPAELEIGASALAV